MNTATLNTLNTATITESDADAQWFSYNQLDLSLIHI